MIKINRVLYAVISDIFEELRVLDLEKKRRYEG